MTAIKTILFTIFLVMGVVTVGVPYLLLGSRWRLPLPIGNVHWPGPLLIIEYCRAVPRWLPRSKLTN
jgi:hypothetical protein